MARARQSVPPTSQSSKLGSALPSLRAPGLWAQPPLGLLRTEIQVNLKDMKKNPTLKASEGNSPSLQRPSPSRPPIC